MNKLLYIGLNGYAGAGKDTVAKMLKTILNRLNEWDVEEFKTFYKSHFTDPTKSATFKLQDVFEDNKVLCIAYADQLKEICSTMFGIPVERFYMNKANAWICINDKFQYTEIKPNEDHILTADEYYYSINSIDTNEYEKYWMSLREILVYVGTYVLQRSVNKQIFVNIVRNKIKEEQLRNPHLKYVIVTDNRFSHELDFIHESNGITMTIVRDSIQQLDNIAEHDLDDVQSYDYIVDNSGTYDELIETIWDIVHSDIEFNNQIEELYTRDNVDNYLRLVSTNEEYKIYKLCAPLGMQELYGSGESYNAINPIGGPMICVDNVIDGTRTINRPEGIIPAKIRFNEETSTYYIYVANGED